LEEAGPIDPTPDLAPFDRGNRSMEQKSPLQQFAVSMHGPSQEFSEMQCGFGESPELILKVSQISRPFCTAFGQAALSGTFRKQQAFMTLRLCPWRRG
jgi:hypothetical protein